MQYHVRLDHIPTPTPTAVVRRLANTRDLPRIIPQACGQVWNVIRARHISGAGRHLALYLDDQINLEVGVELQAPFPGQGEVLPSTLPTGHVATTTHLGPYDQLQVAHRAVRDYCAKHGHTPAGPAWEIYDHWQDAWNADPAHIRTDVFHLLKAVNRRTRGGAGDDRF